MLLADLDSGYLIWIRFATGVNEMETCETKRERTEKCDVLINLFVRPDSRFRLSGLPDPLYHRENFDSNFDWMAQLRDYLVTQLALHAKVAKFIQEHGCG